MLPLLPSEMMNLIHERDESSGYKFNDDALVCSLCVREKNIYYIYGGLTPPMVYKSPI